VRVLGGGATDVGRVRSNNEDCFRLVQPLNLFILSDGMGGEAHGEIASALAVETVVKHCMDADTNPAAPLYGNPSPNLSMPTKRLVSAVHLANRNIFKSAETHPEQSGMGATLTALWINSNALSIAHVGDSRAYLLRSGMLQQLTSDHSLVAEQVRRGIISASEAEQSDMQSVLLRALGTQAEVEVDSEEQALFPRDVLLLCSDGLTRMITEPEIAGTLQAETDPQKAAERLIAIANENGGVDNISVIVIRLENESRSWLSWLLPGGRKHAGSNGSAGGH
jgi:serine/threonine protein phosphatase PrpC